MTDGPGRLESGRPSATAFGVAMLRAAHQLVHDPKVFDDPLATRIIGRGGLERLRKGIETHHGSAPRAELLAHLVARSRYAEDRLADAYRRGIRQYLVLGAGLDTFAWRNPFPDLTVFEIDHPATQEWKRARMRAVGVEVPPNLVFASMDFQTQTLAEALSAAGFDASRAAFASWLGVTMYLDPDAVMRVLSTLGALPPSSEAVFDFNPDYDAAERPAASRTQRIGERTAALGEPFRSRFEPDDLAARVAALGFSQVEILGRSELDRLYFDGRRDALAAPAYSRIARARV